MLSLAAFVAAASAASLPAALPLAASCNVQTAQLAANNWLGMYCNNANVASFAYNWTWINLDWCLANRAGHLAGRKNGHFDASCTRCSTHLRPISVRLPSTDGHTLDLQCACRDAHGRSVSTSIDLSPCLSCPLVSSPTVLILTSRPCARRCEWRPWVLWPARQQDASRSAADCVDEDGCVVIIRMAFCCGCDLLDLAFILYSFTGQTGFIADNSLLL